jgi:hypothetical protein
MSDAPLTLAVLAKFHQDVFLPDVQRIVGEAVDSIERRIDAKFDAVYQRFDRLETEYQMVVAAPFGSAAAQGTCGRPAGADPGNRGTVGRTAESVSRYHVYADRTRTGA